ncbi:MAG: metallophosphoesterase family protein [Anditalea sp.]
MKHFYLFVLLLQIGWVSCVQKNPPEGSVEDTMDGIVSRFYQEFNKSQLDTIGNDFILHYLSEEEKKVLGSKFWSFKVNVPVTLSLMQDVDQKIAPFWLKEEGFEKTAMEVKNTHSVYEVWQKNYDAGRVDLGINGFDKHRPVYFISVGPQNENDKLEITPVLPAQQHFETMEVSSFTYHDWSGLTLTEVPKELNGQVLLTTIRGRAREAHLVGAFRETDFPSSETRDQILLTWSNDPKNTMDIQWRAASSIDQGMVKYWIKDTQDTSFLNAEKFVMEDRLLQNDRFVHRFTAKLTNLKPGTAYEYQVSHEEHASSATYTFMTSNDSLSPFSFIWTGDVHNAEIWGEMMQKTRVKHPESAFYMAAGDLVNTGLHRDDWDKLFSYSGEVFAHKPFMAVPGNHDNQDGLGAWMYKEMFSYPDNGPSPDMSEMTYAFNYQNSLFLMIDATFPIEKQTEWIEEQLASSEADWKFAMFHFPPYNSIEFYQNIIDEWGPLFDNYHVDMVMSGHFHYYMRSKPLLAGKVVNSPAEGTLYVMSIGTTGKNREMKEAPYAALQFGGEYLYQHVEIDGKSFRYTSYDLEGEVRDSIVINK